MRSLGGGGLLGGGGFAGATMDMQEGTEAGSRWGQERSESQRRDGQMLVLLEPR